ncbi:MAG TPA: AIR synthase-related protein, partial [Actinomycetota bacterium]|nr:AIR synthase-related protein [Actinomycetota bacterium]
NRLASEAMLEVGVSAATDVTGFGLLGHLQIALASGGAAAVLQADAVPFLPGTRDLAERGAVPAGTRSNHLFVSPHVGWGELSKMEQLMLADAQTSGGLLITVPADRTEALRHALTSRGVTAAEIGSIVEGEPGHIEVHGRVAGG